MSKHTPGPWIAERLEVRAGYGAFRLVADCTTGKDYVGDEANARLIAAAPELLSALQSLHAAMACYDSTPEEFLSLAAARTAIDKATTGETE